jgi:hypothetical protein
MTAYLGTTTAAATTGVVIARHRMTEEATRAVGPSRPIAVFDCDQIVHY